MRPHFSLVLVFIGPLACSDSHRPVTVAQQAVIKRTIEKEVVAAYDFSKPNVVDNLMALYATDARVVSASSGQVVASRDSLKMGITAFWENVGRNMREPKVEWTSMNFDVLSPTAAVMTAAYRIPHKQPNGLPHMIAGAWTAVFELRGGKWVIIQEHLSDRPF